jgi:hypothetical protein
MQVTYTMVGIVSGAIFFQEFQVMSDLALSMYGLGMAGMTAGIFLSVSPAAFAEGIQDMKGNIEQAWNNDSASPPPALPLLTVPGPFFSCALMRLCLECPACRLEVAAHAHFWRF